MKLKAAAICALVTLSSPAAAQVTTWGPYGPVGPGPVGYGPVGFHEIRASLRAHGMRPISQPVLSGRYVVIRAIDRYGEPVRVLMSARFGDVIQVTPLPSARVAGIYEPRPFRPYVYPERRYEALEPPRRYGAVRPDLKYEPEGPPPSGYNTVPNGHDAAPNGRAAAPRSAAVTPGRTPTPRPRPPAAGATAAITPAPAATETKPAPAAATTDSEAPAVTGSTRPPDGRHTFPPAAPLE